MLPYRLKDLPQHLQEQVVRKLSKSKATTQSSPKITQQPSNQPTPQTQTIALTPYKPNKILLPPLKDSRSTPNRTESRYNKEVLLGNGRYEPLTFHLPGGNYTPDYLTIDDGIPTFHEVKGGYRFGSESRAVLGFKTAAAMYPFFRFVWAVLEKGGKWNVKRIEEPEYLLNKLNNQNNSENNKTLSTQPNIGQLDNSSSINNK